MEQQRLTEAESILMVSEAIVHEVITQFLDNNMKDSIPHEVLLAAHLFKSYRLKYENEDLFNSGSVVRDVMFNLVDSVEVDEKVKQQFRDLFDFVYEVKNNDSN